MSEMDCVLKEYGNCSYSETGCSDCKVKAKIRNALSAQPLSVQPEPCEDAVSRQAVYTVIEEVLYETTKGADNWYGLLNDGVRTLPPVTPKPEQRWIPCTDPTKLPKNKVLWITCEICGCRFLKEVYWNMTEWSDDVSRVIAYMPYVEPEPYREEGNQDE